MITVWQESLGAAVLVCLLALCFVYFGLKLAHADLQTHRLPNRWVLRWAIVTVVLLVLLSIIRAQYAPLMSAGLGLMILGGAYLLMNLLTRGAMGMGDAKLAAVLGLNLGYFWLPSIFLASVLSFVLASLVVLCGILAKKLTTKSAVPFGPFMLIGAACALLMTR